MRQNKTHGFILADQDWIGLMIFKILRIWIGLGLKNFTVRSSLVCNRDEHGSGLDRTGSGLKSILAGQDWIGLQFF